MCHCHDCIGAGVQALESEKKNNSKLLHLSTFSHFFCYYLVLGLIWFMLNCILSSYLPPKSLGPMENTAFDPSVRKELPKNTPESLFKVDCYLADLRVNRKHPQN